MTVWKDVVGYEGLYKVSDNGSVLSVGREVVYTDGRKKITKDRTLNPCVVPQGYVVVSLTKDKKAKTVSVHLLMAQAFLGPKPFEGAEVRHLDDVKNNNIISNLSWGSRSENQKDKWLNLKREGFKHWSSKIDNEDIIAIKVLYRRTKMSQNEIAELFNISPPTVSKILKDCKC